MMSVSRVLEPKTNCFEQSKPRPSILNECTINKGITKSCLATLSPLHAMPCQSPTKSNSLKNESLASLAPSLCWVDKHPIICDSSMAPNQKKTSQKRPKNHWLLACFGIPPKATSEKKSKKSVSRKKSFKLCFPKLKFVVRKKKGSFDAKTAALKVSQSMIMIEATKVHQLKLKHESINQETNALLKGNNHLDNQSPRDKSDAYTCHKQDHSPRRIKKSFFDKKVSKVTKDSMIGISIMLVTLMILSLWGRLCAILSMSAWLYCVPLLRACKDVRPKLENTRLLDSMDTNSEVYKKKVVLEGLLQRDHKTATGVS